MNFNIHPSSDHNSTQPSLLLSQLQNQYQALLKATNNQSQILLQQQQLPQQNQDHAQDNNKIEPSTSSTLNGVPSSSSLLKMSTGNTLEKNNNNMIMVPTQSTSNDLNNNTESGNNTNDDSNNPDANSGNNDGEVDMQGELDRNGQHHPIAEFLYQLTKMLTDDNSEIIEWVDGRIKVHYPERLEGEVLHKYFRHSKFASFQRQLNYFGFRKIAGKGKMSPCSYVNDAATSDIRSLLLIKRKTNGSAARKAAMQQRAAALANQTLNPLLQFPGAAAILANNPSALASLTNPQALSSAMALLSDNALRAGFLAQQTNSIGAGTSPQLSLLLQQQQQQEQQDLQSKSALLSGLRQEDRSNSLGAFNTSFGSLPGMQNGSNPMLHVDHNHIAQHTQQLQQLQQQLQQLQQQHKSSTSATVAPTADVPVSSPSLQAQAAGNKDSGKDGASNDNNSNGPAPGAAASKSQSAPFEQLLAARWAAVNQSAPSMGGLGSLGSASAALSKLSASENPASAALQQQFSSMPATAAMDADSATAQASNNLFESALNLKSLLQEHQATNLASNETSATAASRGALMNRLPSSGTIFPSAASFGNLLNSSNRLSSLLSLSSFVGGPGGNLVGDVGSREQSLADMSPYNMGGNQFNAAALAAWQQHANPASAAANQFHGSS